jgi:NAD(P)-dependent dehydrogenase (short-subunit alcohol dehydrogenase family)
MDLQQKAAVVIGGASGISRATVLELARRGAIGASVDWPGGRDRDRREADGDRCD